MLLEIVAGCAALAAVAAAGFVWRHYAQRARYHKDLAARRIEIVARNEPELALVGDGGELKDAFNADYMVRAGNLLCRSTLETLRKECIENTSRLERSYIPLHKKGATLSYEKIHHYAPGCLALFHSAKTRAWLSNVVGASVVPTADHDQSSCSLLVYNEPGDHINWHYDHNFYNGRHFTVLVSLFNRSERGGPSSSCLQRKTADGREINVDTSENVIVVFEGARVLHRATQTSAGDLRVMLSMTFSTNPTLPWHKEFVRRCKDVAYYGLKVLWH